MKKKCCRFLEIIAILCLIFSMSAVSCLAADTEWKVQNGENSGIEKIEKIEIRDDGNGGKRLYVEGIAQEADTEIYMALMGPYGRTTNVKYISGHQITDFYCMPAEGAGFADGSYQLSLIDTYKDIKKSEAADKGYRVDFVIKGNAVQNTGEEGKAGDVDEENPPSIATNSSIEIGDINGHWAEADIRALIDKKIVSGYKDGTFRPDDKVTRAEFAQIVKTAFHIGRTKELTIFQDVKKENWYYDAVAALYENKIVSGTGATEFSPDATISREQMAVILFNMTSATNMDLAIIREYIPFLDDSGISDYAKEAVKTMYQTEIINGVKDIKMQAYRFMPLEGATRAEVAAIINKLLNQADE